MKKLILYILIPFVFAACSKTSKSNDKKALARVNENYLYPADVEGMGAGLSAEDSSRQIALYIEKWAVDQLMLEMAKNNISKSGSEKIDRLVEAYRNSLIIAAYEEQMLQKELDTVVTPVQISEYYKANQDQYISGNEWVRCHFIRIKRSMPEIDNLRNWFKSGDKKDFEKVKQYCLSKQGINFVLDSEQWVNLEKIGEMLPEKSVESSKLQTDRSYDRTDDDYLYLLRVFEIRDRDSPLPLSQVKEEITKIILQQRSSEILQGIRKKAAEKAKSGKVFEKF